MPAHTDRRQRRPGGAAGVVPALVGRDDALGRVTAALAAGSALVLVEGEAGIGKTRLLREALAVHTGRADHPGVVLAAACPPVPEPSPLGAVTAALRRLRPDVDALGLSPLAGALRALLPEWANELPPTPERLDDPAAVRQLVYRALSELVERLRVDVLVVEDAHWADSATLEWLLTLCADDPVGRRGLSIVVTFRPWDVPAGSLLPRLTSRTPPGMTKTRIGLSGLRVEDVQQLVANVYASEHVSEYFAEFLHTATDGIPLAVEEYLLLLQDRADIVLRNGQWTRKTLARLEVPATVRESVLERVHRLAPTTQRVLEAASILADPADEALLAAVAGLSEEDVRPAMADALRSGLLRERSAGRFGFRHVLDAQAIGGAVPASERRRVAA